MLSKECGRKQCDRKRNAQRLSELADESDSAS